MKRLWAGVLCALLLTGCSAAGQIEGQAFVVSMAVDLEEDGGMTVSIQYPSYGARGGEEGKSDYLISSASGDGFDAALYALNAAVPRTVNLTQLKSLIVSEKLASSNMFQPLLNKIKLSYRINGEAYLVVATGRAADFMARQKPLIGLRLSDTIVTAMSRYERLGGIPRSMLSETFYAMNSFYDDPVAILAAVADEQTASTPDEPEDAEAGELSREGENSDEYFGAALFRGGAMAGRLSGGETQLLRLIRGGRGQMTMELDGATVAVTRHGALRVAVDLNGDAPRLDVSFEAGVENLRANIDEMAVVEELTRGLNDLTAKCQRLGVDPFGYGRYAAARFTTIGDWLAYDWRTRFPQAEITYHVTLRQINA